MSLSSSDRVVIGQDDGRRRSLAEALRNKIVVDVSEYGAILAVEDHATQKLATAYAVGTQPDMTELGTSGTTSWGNFLRDEYNPELRGYLGLKMYDKMRRSDAKIRATLRLIKTPVLGARWYVDPASPSAQDKMIADKISDNLFNDMSVSWPQFLRECLLHIDFGFYAFEKVFTQHDGMIQWQKFAPRHPMDLWEWDYDSNGGPNGARFYGPAINKGAATFYAPGMYSSQSVYIPIQKLMVFTFDQEGGNLTGIPLLRSAYKHWYFKENLYKIDAIQKERHGIGIPVITLPQGFKDEDKIAANELGENLRTNEKAHVVLPPLWSLEFAEIKGQPVDCMKSIEHHDKMIAHNILAPFLESPTGGQEDSQTLFLKSSRYIADHIRDVINKWAIPELVAYNWGSDVEPPELKVRNIGYTVDWRTLSFALRNLVGAGIVIPDDELEDWIREEMDLPAPDDKTARVVASPQQVAAVGAAQGDPQPTSQELVPGTPKSPAVGLPRQSTAAGNQQGKNAGSTGRVGQDKSGG